MFSFQSSYQNSKRVSTNRTQSISISNLMQNPKDKLDLNLKIDWVSSTLSQKTQTSLSKNSNLCHQIRALSANLSRWWRCCVGGLVVAMVAGGLWVLWHGFLLGYRAVRWLRRGGGVVTGHGSIWVVGCGLGIDVDGEWCVAGNSGLSLFFHSPILSLLSSLFLSLRFYLSDWVLV